METQAPTTDLIMAKIKPNPARILKKRRTGPQRQSLRQRVQELPKDSACSECGVCRWKFAVESTGDGLWDWNVADNTVFFSETWKAMLGYSQDEVSDGLAEWEQRIHPDDRAVTIAAVQAYLDGTTSSYNVEHRLRCKDGSYKWILDRGKVIRRAADGRPLRVIGTHKDISERKEAQRCLNELTANLEEKIKIRTQELEALAVQLTLTEERERHILAQELHDNHGQLLAILRIKLSKLGDTKDIAEIIDLAERAEQSARMVTRMLNPPSLSMTTMVQVLEWLVQEIEDSYGLTVHLAVEGSQPELSEAIKAILLRSVRELLVNVAKHARVSSADLTYLGDEGQLRLVVGDDGCGFVPFDYAAVLPGQRSFGLSSIAQRFASIGGQMLIDSSPGGGTTVTLSLPWSIAIRKRPPP